MTFQGGHDPFQLAGLPQRSDLPRRRSVRCPTFDPLRTDSTKDKYSYTLSPLRRRVVFTNIPRTIPLPAQLTNHMSPLQIITQTVPYTTKPQVNEPTTPPNPSNPPNSGQTPPPPTRPNHYECYEESAGCDPFRYVL